MPTATIRRYRGFFASRARDLTVRTTDPSSLVRTAVVSEPGESQDKLVVDREGARLENVSALPWQTLVMREGRHRRHRRGHHHPQEELRPAPA